jgi:hypothetical protein
VRSSERSPERLEEGADVCGALGSAAGRGVAIRRRWRHGGRPRKGPRRRSRVAVGLGLAHLLAKDLRVQAEICRDGSDRTVAPKRQANASRTSSSEYFIGLSAGTTAPLREAIILTSKTPSNSPGTAQRRRRHRRASPEWARAILAKLATRGTTCCRPRTGLAQRHGQEPRSAVAMGTQTADVLGPVARIDGPTPPLARRLADS